MAGKINRATTIICPGPESWERWESGESTTLSSTSPDPGAWSQTEGSIVALPLRHVWTLPLWLPKGDDKNSVADLELEMRGVKKPGSDTPVAFSEVTSEDTRSLTLVFVGSSQLPDGLIHPRASAYEVWARLLPLRENAFLFWKELGDWCFALTRENALVYAQAAGSQLLDGQFEGELRRLLLRLHSESVLPQEPTTCVWFTTPSPAERDAINHILPGIKHHDEKECVPVAPKNRIDLAPGAVEEARKKRQAGARLGRLGIFAGVAYVLFLILLVTRYLLGVVEMENLRRDLDAQQSDVAELVEISANWNAMRQAVDTTFFGIDQLFECAQMLPEKDVRLTTFSLNGPRLQLSGEARTVPLAFEYIDRIKKNPDLAMYRWEAPQPTVLPNNSASFQIVGIRDDVSIIRR